MNKKQRGYIEVGSTHANNCILDIFPRSGALLFLERPELVQHMEISPDVKLVVLQS